MTGFRVTVTRGNRLQLSGDCLYLHQVLAGSATVNNLETSHHLVEDGFLIQNVGTQHEVVSTDSPVVSIALNTLVLNGQRFTECLTPHDFEIHRAVSKLLQASSSGSKQTYGALELSDALLKARDRSNQNYHLVEPNFQHRELVMTMKSAREFILSQLSGPLLVSHVADRVALSEFHFHRLFKRWHGIAPGSYIVNERVRRACRKLILGDEPVSKVAEACGFFSPTSFTRAFRSVTGLTPSEFRVDKRHFRSELTSFLTAT